MDIYTEDQAKAILCFGDSITARAWPEYLQRYLLKSYPNVSSVRKAISGSRVLREYTCLTYEKYGYKSETRFKHEANLSGCDTVIILQGVNDIIHPVGEDVNPFRPTSDLPTVGELIDGYRVLIKLAHDKGMKVYLGTILPFKNWRTYAPFREDIRQLVNSWIRTTNEIDGYIDFDQAMRSAKDEFCLVSDYDSGDHLHPSNAGAKQMAKTALKALERYNVL